MTCSSSLWGGLLYSVPFAVWFFAAIEGADTPLEVEGTIRDAFRVLVLVQALAAVTLHPSLRCGAARRDLMAVLAFLAIPWPLLAVLYLAGNLGVMLLLASQLVLTLGTLALISLSTVLQRTLQPTFRPLAPPTLQVAGLAAVLFTSGPWLQWAARS